MTSVGVMGLLILALAVGGVFLLWKVLQGIFWGLGQLLRGVGRLLRHVLVFVRHMFVDVLHTAGATLTAAAIVPLSLGNMLIGRGSAARHYGGAMKEELGNASLGLYRLAVGHPLRLLGLGTVIQGLERRIPDLVAHAPRQANVPGDGFAGYDVLGQLPSGGSGARLFVARPRPETYVRFQNLGLVDEQGALPDEVVIKSFALEQGSTLPMIVRENRALEAARRIGLVFEHVLTEDRFFYVMPYVKGDGLDRVVRRMHGRAAPEGLGNEELGFVVALGGDLLGELERFHSGGLWHKDVKPSNVIVADGRAHLVDFGLVTPLASALTLTTHGTEYYRDPEMVKLAMRGARVQDVDGVKFDIYSAGALLYSMIEDSFPAHGSLSRLGKRCPEALRWVVQRAMTDLDRRYGSAREMRDDLLALAAAPDLFAMRPADLPSVRGGSNVAAGATEESPRVSPASSAPADEASAYAASATDPYVASVGTPFPPTLYGDGTERSSWRRSYERHRRRLRPLRAAFHRGSAPFTGGALFAGGPAVEFSEHVPQGAPTETRSKTRSERRDQRRPRRLALVAGLLVAGIGGFATVVNLARGQRQEWAQASQSSHAHARSASTVSVDSLRLYESERDTVSLAQDLLEGSTWDERLEQIAARWRDGLDTTAAPAPPAPPVAPAGMVGSAIREAHRRVLVLEDMASEVSRDALGSLSEALEQRGLEVLGLGSDPADQELLASAKYAVGLYSADDEEARTALQRFLDGTDLDAIVWLSKDGERPDAHRYRVLVRSDLAAGAQGWTPADARVPEPAMAGRQ